MYQASIARNRDIDELWKNMRLKRLINIRIWTLIGKIPKTDFGGLKSMA
jgi:hypothetical protein